MASEMTHGTFVWNELMTPDTQACKRFYGEVLGWTSRDMPVPGGEDGSVYTMWVNGDKDAGGMMKMEGARFEGVPPNWLAYIGVDDVDAAVARVTQNGGAVRVPPTEIPGVGRFAVIADPTGAVVALMTGAG